MAALHATHKPDAATLRAADLPAGMLAMLSQSRPPPCASSPRITHAPPIHLNVRGPVPTTLVSLLFLPICSPCPHTHPSVVATDRLELARRVQSARLGHLEGAVKDERRSALLLKSLVEPKHAANESACPLPRSTRVQRLGRDRPFSDRRRGAPSRAPQACLMPPTTCFWLADHACIVHASMPRRAVLLPWAGEPCLPPTSSGRGVCRHGEPSRGRWRCMRAVCAASVHDGCAVRERREQRACATYFRGVEGGELRRDGAAASAMALRRACEAQAAAGSGGSSGAVRPRGAPPAIFRGRRQGTRAAVAPAAVPQRAGAAAAAPGLQRCPPPPHGSSAGAAPSRARRQPERALRLAIRLLAAPALASCLPTLAPST
jgi:hypothetical protein